MKIQVIDTPFGPIEIITSPVMPQQYYAIVPFSQRGALIDYLEMVERFQNIHERPEYSTAGGDKRQLGRPRNP